MSTQVKETELDFHCDRMRETCLQVTRSILGNPTLTPQQQILLLSTLADKYVAIGELIKSQLDYLLLKTLEKKESAGGAVLAQQVRTEVRVD